VSATREGDRQKWFCKDADGKPAFYVCEVRGSFQLQSARGKKIVKGGFGSIEEVEAVFGELL